MGKVKEYIQDFEDSYAEDIEQAWQSYKLDRSPKKPILELMLDNDMRYEEAKWEYFSTTFYEAIEDHSDTIPNMILQQAFDYEWDIIEEYYVKFTEEFKLL
tara:strand:+ start:380 stop:682 length:303 start_codon:yes stop_codon:yes gene_type:complete